MDRQFYTFPRYKADELGIVENPPDTGMVWERDYEPQQWRPMTNGALVWNPSVEAVEADMSDYIIITDNKSRAAGD